jgi:hypothetical protein
MVDAAAPAVHHIPAGVLRTTAFWFETFRADWIGEVPERIHSREVDAGGAPQWHPDFENWICSAERTIPETRLRSSDHKIRTTRAIRRLRRESVREFEVLYRTMVLGEPVRDTARWLSERAERNNKTDRYTVEDVLVMVVAGVDKVRAWW